ncbi:MAG TPA: PilZ domain-containing protein [Syntrophales bacterium]|nr:PilZ domain-containing protein [Syntrophales bacterium]
MIETQIDHTGEKHPTESDHRETPSLSSWVFRSDFLKRRRSAEKLSANQLINIINLHHFKGTPLQVHLRDVRYGEDFLAEAFPECCQDRTITCRWKGDPPNGSDHLRLLNLVIPDGQSVILVPIPEMESINGNFTIQIPEKGLAIGKRCARRHPAPVEIAAEITQSGFTARGNLIDFSNQAFRIQARTDYPDSFHWFQPDRPILTRLSIDGNVVYSSSCRCIRHTPGVRSREIVLTALPEPLPRTRNKPKRSFRHRMNPTAYITCRHPLSGERIQRDIHDLSLTGFSVFERPDDGVLLQGLVLPQVQIHFPGGAVIAPRARVAYRQEKGSRVICGLAFLDMDIQEYKQLSHILTNMTDPHLFVSQEPDLDALWSFLFQTGFLYPKKYRMIQEYRDQFKETYRKLYCNHPEIAEHFLYQEDGIIYGHLSMVKAYERSWMVHHLAARRKGSLRVALAMLKLIVNYFEGIHRLPSVRMDHLVFYFRPENRFPNLVGDFAKAIKEPRACSQDLFAFIEFPTNDEEAGSLPPGWTLEELTPARQRTLESFYRHFSGGLLMDVLNARPGEKEPTVEEFYRRNGMVRRVSTHALLYDGQMKAALWRNESDLGLNLSELLNGFKVFMLDPAGTPWKAIQAAVGQLTAVYGIPKVPVMIYPATYPGEQGIKQEKQYSMWILDVQYGRAFINYMERKIQRSKPLLALLQWAQKMIQR